MATPKLDDEGIIAEDDGAKSDTSVDEQSALSTYLESDRLADFVSIDELQVDRFYPEADDYADMENVHKDVALGALKDDGVCVLAREYADKLFKRIDLGSPNVAQEVRDTVANDIAGGLPGPEETPLDRAIARVNPYAMNAQAVETVVNMDYNDWQQSHCDTLAVRRDERLSRLETEGKLAQQGPKTAKFFNDYINNGNLTVYNTELANVDATSQGMAYSQSHSNRAKLGVLIAPESERLFNLDRLSPTEQEIVTKLFVNRSAPDAEPLIHVVPSPWMPDPQHPDDVFDLGQDANVMFGVGQNVAGRHVNPAAVQARVNPGTHATKVYADGPAVDVVVMGQLQHPVEMNLNVDWANVAVDEQKDDNLLTVNRPKGPQLPASQRIKGLLPSNWHRDERFAQLARDRSDVLLARSTRVKDAPDAEAYDTADRVSRKDVAAAAAEMEPLSSSDKDEPTFS